MTPPTAHTTTAKSISCQVEEALPQLPMCKVDDESTISNVGANQQQQLSSTPPLPEPSVIEDEQSTNTRKTLHIAPMLNYSTREFRQLFRILSRKSVLWTEMVVDDTVAHSTNLEEHLGYDDNTHPIVCQIGGNCPKLCGQATAIAIERYKYDEINLNIDCPSERVSGEREFGAVLLTKIDLVVQIISSMRQQSKDVVTRQAAKDRRRRQDCSTSLYHSQSLEESTRTTTPLAGPVPISIKTRVGVDDWDDLDFIAGFIRKLSPICKKFHMHARKCVLGGILNARQNRSVPPLNYPRVYELCRLFPDCEFWINGGIHSLKDAKLIAYGKVLSTRTMASDTIKNDSCNNTDSRENNANPEVSHEQQQECHSVPCHVCCHPNNDNSNSSTTTTAIRATNGSCTAPPIRSPPNLRGVMLGRAAMDNPAMFWDVDRYYYGDATNPCQTRRDALEKYCIYLEQTYPRRCCDSDDRITYEYPPPRVVHDQDYCNICAPMYNHCCSSNGRNGGSMKCTTSGDELVNDGYEKEPMNLFVKVPPKTKSKSKNAVKINSRIIGRSLKPVQGIFYNMPKSRAFRKACDRLGQNMEVRNCGPGYIIRKAMESVPDQILDEAFIKTEDLG